MIEYNWLLRADDTTKNTDVTVNGRCRQYGYKNLRNVNKLKKLIEKMNFLNNNNNNNNNNNGYNIWRLYSGITAQV